MGARRARWATAATLVVIAGLIAAASVWMIRNAPDRSAQAGETVPGVVPIASLPFAACYAIPRDARGEIVTGNGVYPTNCEQEHDGQILEQVSLDNLAWAGAVPMKASAQNQCSTAFNRYRATFEDPDNLIPGYFLPDEKLWNSGNRTITCTLTMEAPFTGSKM